MALSLKLPTVCRRFPPKMMNSSQADILQELEELGYDVRLEGDCFSVITPSGAELIRVPLVQLAAGELPPDLLDRRDRGGYWGHGWRQFWHSRPPI